MLFHDVPLQITRLFVGVVALLTGKRFLASVGEHMVFQTIVLTGSVAALVTCKWLFSSVFELVLLKMNSLSGRKVTLLTPERLLS